MNRNPSETSNEYNKSSSIAYTRLQWSGQQRQQQERTKWPKIEHKTSDTVETAEKDE